MRNMRIRITRDDMLVGRLYEILMRLVEADIEGTKALELRRVLLEEVATIIGEAGGDESLYSRAARGAEAQADAEAEFDESS